MQGWMIENGFLRTGKFSEMSAWMRNASKKQGIRLKVFGNDRFLIRYGETGMTLEGMEERPDFILFWDKDVELASAFEALHIPVFNCAEAIAACDDKSRTHRILSAGNIPMPDTIRAPMTFANVGYTNTEFLSEAEERLSYPFVIKECFGSFGAQVYLIHDRAEARRLLETIGGKPMIFQKYIRTSTGRDVRINMVGEEPVAAMLRCNPGDFRANVTNGGSMRPYTPTPEQIALAQKACRMLKLDFAGVDLLFGEDERPVLCEVNSNAHVKNIFDCTGIDVGESIFAHIRSRLGQGC